jgi:hypothetical protein
MAIPDFFLQFKKFFIKIKITRKTINRLSKKQKPEKLFQKFEVNSKLPEKQYTGGHKIQKPEKLSTHPALWSKMTQMWPSPWAKKVSTCWGERFRAIINIF